ncbi:MAG: spondin domain-containing protein [Burkholderiaceae bacterium]
MTNQCETSAAGKLRSTAALLIVASLIAACGGGSDNSGPETGDDQPAGQNPPAVDDEQTEPDGADDEMTVPEPEPAPPGNPSPAPADPPPPATATGEATYEFIFTAQWTGENGFGNVPGNAHFSGIIGAAVNEQSRLWARGGMASAGVEAVAEDGTVPTIRAEMNAEIAANAAREIMFVGGPRNSGSVSGTITFSDAHPALTFITMVAPSPDWFVGLSRQSMKDASGQWIASFDRELPVYDAGTEQGESFSTNGAATNPQGVITRLNGLVADSLPFVEGTVNGNAIARLQLRRLR